MDTSHRTGSFVTRTFSLVARTATSLVAVTRVARAALSLVAVALVVRAALSLVAVALVAGCLSTLPDDDDPPASRVIVQWDPLDCGDPHRVVLELEHEDGTDTSSSVPCVLGSLSVDLSQWGVYFGRFYAWTAGVPIRRIEPVTLTVDAPVIHWHLADPP